jgi:CheY-like chemotaxis protein
MIKVLIADDDLAIVDAISLALIDEGYVVKSVTEDPIVEAVIDFSPDVVLLDIWMKNIDGGEVCRQIKAMPWLDHTKVILISANKDIASIAKYSGADDYLAKPLDLSTLFSRIQQAAAKPAKMEGV